MFCFAYFTLFIKVYLYVVLLLCEEIQTFGFEFYDLKPNASNEHYIKEKNFKVLVNKKLFDESHMTQK